MVDWLLPMPLARDFSVEPPSLVKHFYHYEDPDGNQDLFAKHVAFETSGPSWCGSGGCLGF